MNEIVKRSVNVVMARGTTDDGKWGADFRWFSIFLDGASALFFFPPPGSVLLSSLSAQAAPSDWYVEVRKNSKKIWKVDVLVMKT